jgi:hypothetical protein
VEGAGEGALVGALVATQHRAAVAAGIDEGAQLAIAVARNDDELAAHPGREVVVLVRDLALVRQVDPVAFEDVLHLELKEPGIGEDVPRDTEHALPGVVF